MLVAVEPEILERGHGPRELVDRVVAQMRHRAVCAPPARARVQPDDALVGHTRVVGGGLRHQHGGGVAERARVGEPARARAARLLAGAENHLDAGVARSEGRQALGRRDDRGQPCLHVARPATVEAVAVDLSAQRLAGPLGLTERHRVEMRGQDSEGRTPLPAQRATTLSRPGASG